MVKTCLALVAALLAAAPAVPAQDKAPKTEQDLVTLTCKPPRKRGRQALLQLSGRAELPDFTVFQLAVYRQEEMYAGGKLIYGPGTSTSGLTRVLRTPPRKQRIWRTAINWE